MPASCGSYRELPKILYHFQTKERDEPRPRGGLIRVREFVMKDAYSFDRDDEGLDASFRAHAAAYTRMFERCGLDFVAVEAESGMMGGSESVDYLAPAGSGENTLVTCERGDYAADLEIAHGVPRAPSFPGAAGRAGRGRDAGNHDVRGARRLPRHRRRGDVEGDAGRRRREGRPRARERRRPARRRQARRGPRVEYQAGRKPTRSGRRSARTPARSGPVGFDGVVVLDEALRTGQFVAGANRTGYHLRGVEHGRDFDARLADIRLAREGDTCPRCGGALRFQTAIEVGHIFKLGAVYSAPLDATYLDEQSVEHPLVMGCYGIGPGRVLAAVVEQRHDERGIVWPASVAPYDAHVLSLGGGSDDVAGLAADVAEELSAAGRDVLLDDRDARPGEKFADADLLGCPLRVTVGKKSLDDGSVDVRRRSETQDTRVPRASVIDWTMED